MAGIPALRLSLGCQTTSWPSSPASLPAGFRGRPVVDPSKCASGCAACAEACPTQAIDVAKGLALDLGRCVFCPACVEACPQGAIRWTPDARLATSKREDLVLVGNEARLAEALGAKIRGTLGRSLRLRQVSAGGCNGCEAELVATGNVVFDLSRFGVQFVASPRHADGIVVTGPVTRAMEPALLATWEAIPAPKIAIAVGACAISGGVFRGSPDARPGLERLLPIDLYVPGCPPHPITVLDGLLRLLGRLPPSADPPRMDSPRGVT